MRSRMIHTITAREVHGWALDWLLQAKLLRDHGWLCTAAVVWNVVLRAAARTSSVVAACRDLAHAPCQQAVFDALRAGLPKRLETLALRLNMALTDPLPRGLRRPAWQVAIDWHLVPYYGLPHKSRDELCFGKPRQGTQNFHAYATACIVQHGQRYTLGLVWVRRRETMVEVLAQLIAQVREIGLKIRCLLLDRAFFNVPVVTWLKAEKLRFLMPVMFRGRRPKKGRPLRGLHWIKRQRAGWYEHTMRNRKREVTVRVCVAYRTHRNRKDGRRVQQKLLFAAWGVGGSPRELKQRYRKRFGIESCYRQLRQARITTCTRDPHLRLLFVALALLLRNLWVWAHRACLHERGSDPDTSPSGLCFERLLDWVAQTVVALLHDGSTPCVHWHPAAKTWKY